MHPRKLYEDLLTYKQKAQDNQTNQIPADIRETLQITDPADQKQADILAAFDDAIAQQSMQIQATIQDREKAEGKISKAPHVDNLLRARRLSETMRYEERLQYILSQPKYFVKINPDHLQKRKETISPITNRINK